MSNRVKILGVIATICLMLAVGLGGQPGAIALTYRINGIAYQIHELEDGNFTLVSTILIGYSAAAAILFIMRRSRDLISWGFLLAMTVLGLMFCISETLLFFGVSISFPYIHWPLATVVLLWAFLLISSHIHPIKAEQSSPTP